MTAELVAAVMFVGVVVYAVFGGADYGAGLWDLAAGRGERGAAVRRQIDRSIGPVWEANHVWLIFVIVMLWSGFPEAFAAIMTTLAVPWALVGLGIVFRGGAFVFRKSSATFAEARLHGVVFAVSSITTPFFLGTIAGAIASGRVPIDGDGDPLTSWTGPLSLVGGVLAVLTTGFVAAVLLAADANARDPSDLHGGRALVDWFRTRALVAAVVTGAVALIAAITIELTAEELAGGLHGRAAPLIVISGLGGAATMWALREHRFVLARVAAVVAVASIVTGWGVAQYPHILIDGDADVGCVTPTDCPGTFGATIDEAAGAEATLQALLIVSALAVVIVLPALVWLFRLASRPRWN